MQIMTIAPKLAALPGMTVDSVDPGTGGAFAAVLDAGAAVVAMPSITRSAPEIAEEPDDAGAESEDVVDGSVFGEEPVAESASIDRRHFDGQHSMPVPEAELDYQPPIFRDRPADPALAPMLPQQGWTATDKTPHGLSDMRAALTEPGPDVPDDATPPDANASPMVAGPDVIRSTRASAELNRPAQGGSLAAGQLVVLSLSPQTTDATGAVATSDSNLRGVQVGSSAALKAEPATLEHLAFAQKPRSPGAVGRPEISRGSGQYPVEDTGIAMQPVTDQSTSYRAVLAPAQKQGPETSALVQNGEWGTGASPQRLSSSEQPSAPSSITGPSTVRSSVPETTSAATEPAASAATSPHLHAEQRKSAHIAQRSDVARFDQTPATLPARTSPHSGPKTNNFELDRASTTGYVTSPINTGSQAKTKEQELQQTVVSAFDFRSGGESSSANIRQTTLAEPSRHIPPHPVEPHRQIADAIVRSRDGTVEILLDPVELGRVTVLLGSDTHPGRLGILVERPETLDMIRRHADELVRDLRDNGMPDARMDFLRQDSSGGQNRGRQMPGPAEANAPKPVADTSVPPNGTDRRSPLQASGARLDIRL